MSVTLISNPPYNMKWRHPPFARMQRRFNDCELPPESNANYAFILTAMDYADKAVFLLPGGVLSTDNSQEKTIRKHLVDKNIIEAVITCPDKMFESTSIPTCIIILNKNKTTTDVSFCDMRQTYEIEKREQNGQYGGASHEKRTYIKEVKIFTVEHMEKAINAINNRQDIPGFSRTATNIDIAKNDYTLTPSRYIDFQGETNTHREYAEIVSDLNRVIKDQNLLKLTINETMAKSLGLYKFAELQKDSRRTGDHISKMMVAIAGCEILKDDYVSLTKNKGEIKFENNSKDEVSHIFLSILQMYKTHIMYLNNEENRYLAELRNALLPDLMSGKIQLPDENN